MAVLHNALDYLLLAVGLGFVIFFLMELPATFSPLNTA